MNALFAAAVFACVGSALGQMHCMPASFKATSFDSRLFSPFHVTHNTAESKTLYSSNTLVRLFDDNAEELYELYSNGSCTMYNNTRGHVDPALVAAAMMAVKPAVDFRGEDDKLLVGYDIDGGFLKVKVVLDRDDCHIHYVNINSGGEQLLDNFNMNHQDVTDDDLQEITDVLADFHSRNCSTITL